MTFTATAKGDGDSARVSLQGIDTVKLSGAVLFPPFWMEAAEPLSPSATGLSIQNGILAARKPHGIILGPDSVVLVRAAAVNRKGRAAFIVGSTVTLGAGTQIILNGNYASLLFNEKEDISLPPKLTICITGTDGGMGGTFGGPVEFRDGAAKDLAGGWTYMFNKPMVVYGKDNTDPNTDKPISLAPPEGKTVFEVEGLFFAYKGNLDDFGKIDDNERYTHHASSCQWSTTMHGGGPRAKTRFDWVRPPKVANVTKCPTYSDRRAPLTTLLPLGSSTQHLQSSTGQHGTSDGVSSTSPGTSSGIHWAVWLVVVLVVVSLVASVFVCYKKSQNPESVVSSWLSTVRSWCSSPDIEEPLSARGIEEPLSAQGIPQSSLRSAEKVRQGEPGSGRDRDTSEQ